jgi:RNA-directed DNA polymerase
MLKHIPMDKRLLRLWLQAGYWDKDQLFPTHAGTPQGGILSPLLANLTLDGMQAALRQAVRPTGDKVNFVRYADDFIVTGATQEILEQKIKPALIAFLSQRGLELSEQKTVITHVDNGFNFLGHTVRRYGDKVLTHPAKSNLQALRKKIRTRVQTAAGLSQEALIRQLNPLLRGWANYYRHSSAKRTFSQLDTYLHRQIWNWTKRRHPQHSDGWRKEKYFSAAGPGWNFSVRLAGPEGKSRLLTLYRMASTKIRRHSQIIGAANPYDLKYTAYFEQRRSSARRASDRRTSLIQTFGSLMFKTVRFVKGWLPRAPAKAPVGKA